MSWTDQTEAIIGKGGINRLGAARIIIFGVGGVGSYVVEALVRAGIGNIDIVDCDTVSDVSVSRQLSAYYSCIGRPKADVCRERIEMINYQCGVNSYEIFATPDNIMEFPISECDFVVDTVDKAPVKVALAAYCEKLGVPVISSMGVKNRLNPALYKVADIFETTVCPAAAEMREELKKADVKSLRVVYSTEVPIEGDGGYISYIPGIVGMIIAGEIIKNLLTGVVKE